MSKGLEALDNLVQSCFNPCDSDEVLNNKAIVEKELRALKIIKEKRIDIESFYTTFIENSYNYSFYEISYGTYGKYKLTQEEFNLLKEVLEC